VRRTGLPLLLALASGLAGCSGAPLATDFELAHARERARDDEGALAVYRQVHAGCEAGRKRPHDDCALAVVREAQLEEKLGRPRDAYQAWLAAAQLSEDRRKIARALSRAAELADEELHDEAAALAHARRAVREFPDEVPSDDALRLLVKLGKRSDPRALASELDALWPKVKDADLGDNVLFERAELARTVLGDPASAVRFYDQLAATYRRSPLRDDALWRAAGVEREAGHPQAAVKHLQALLDTRRDAYITGSYNSEFLDDAELMMGRVWLDDLHDVGQAIAHFSALADDYPESTLRDDALYELARAELARKNTPAACARLARLDREFPDSNRRRQAAALASELACSR
jgi:tetratricopeptide (TPR) repeat protein